MSNLYKYRVNNKWYTFDKSILDPQDVMIFDKANWSDKLKIIKIYEDLHSVEGDDVQILSTKKIDDKKDKRRREYERKKEAINKKITEANETNNIEAAEKAIKELETLKVEYADIVEVNSANTVNIAKAQDVNIKNINKLVLDAQTQLKDIKQNLTNADFENIKKSLNEIINSKSSEEIKEIIEGLKSEVKDLQENSLKPEMLKMFNEKIDDINEKLNDINRNEFYDTIINNKLTRKEIGDNMPLIKRYALITDEIDKSGLSLNDFNFVKDYPLSFDFVKQFTDPLKALKYLSNYMKIFYNIQLNVGKNDYLTIEKLSKTDKLLTGNIKNKFDEHLIYPYNNNGVIGYNENVLRSNFNNVGFEGDTIKLIYLRRTTDSGQSPQIKYYTEYLEVTGFNYYDQIVNIYNNKQTSEAEKPGAIEGGFLGLKTNKQAKKDFENLQNQINDLSKQVKELQKQISDLRNPTATYHPASLPVNKLFDDIQKGVELRKVETVKPVRIQAVKPVENLSGQKLQAFGNSSSSENLINVLNKRRQDIEPDEYEEDNGDVWADGLELETLQGCGGGLLSELKKDLEKYGLMLKVSPKIPGAYFVNVFEKRKGKGIEEAKQITEEAKNNGSYQSIKELYEDLYSL